MRQPFEVVSGLMNRLDILLVCDEITYEQWVDSYSMFETLGWSDGDICMEVDARWLPSTNSFGRNNESRN